MLKGTTVGGLVQQRIYASSLRSLACGTFLFLVLIVAALTFNKSLEQTAMFIKFKIVGYQLEFIL